MRKSDFIECPVVNVKGRFQAHIHGRVEIVYNQRCCFPTVSQICVESWLEGTTYSVLTAMVGPQTPRQCI